MENVHKPEDRNWISDPLKVKEFREDWQKRYKSAVALTRQASFESHNMTKIPVTKGQQSIDPVLLKDEVELKYAENDTTEIPEGCGLKTLINHKEDLQLRVNPRYKAFVIQQWRNWSIPRKPIKDEELILNPDVPKVTIPEVILSVQLLRPEDGCFKMGNMHPSRAPAFMLDQEYSVLGSQTLLELKNKVFCVSDYTSPEDLSDSPFCKPQHLCKDIYKSGFFYINGVFYNDDSDSQNMDYSDVIMQWASKSATGIGPFKKSTMNTAFIDLELQLGYPYVYVHQGDCEHILLFYDMRMFSGNDSLIRSDYPLQKRLNAKRKVKCMTCQTHVAEWIIVKHHNLPENHYFLCNTCHLSFNYNAQGKRGEFEAYKYVDRTCYPP